MYMPGLSPSQKPCEVCKQDFITREGSDRKICLKCANASLAKEGPIPQDVQNTLTMHREGQS